METLKSFFSEQVIEAFGWAIFHSVWQITLLLIVLVVVLFFMKSFSARIRYFVSYSVLLSSLIWVGATGVSTYRFAQEKQELKERLLTSPDGIVSEIKLIIESSEKQSIAPPSNIELKWMTFKGRAQANFYIVFYLWFIGILFFLIKMAGGLAAMQKLSRQKNALIEDKWRKLGDDLSKRLRIRQQVKILESYLVKVPMVIGKLKPVILIPIELLTGLSNEQIEAIIAHELAHIKRNDYVFNIIQSVIDTLFFYHPAVWIISRIIRDEREHSCDDLAISVTGDKLNYIKALASAQEFTLKTQINAVAFAQSGSGLLTRVKRLKTMNNMKNKVSEGFFAASLIFIGLVMLSFTLTSSMPARELTESFDPIESSSKFSPLINKELSPENFRVLKDTLEKKVKKRVEKMEEVPEELETVIEVALLEEDEAMAAEILASVEEALKEIEWEAIQIDIEAAQAELEAINMDSIMREAHAEIERELKELKEHEKELSKEMHISEVEAMELAKEAMEIASETLEAINLDSIIEFSVQTSLEVLKDIELDVIIKEALEAIEIELDSGSNNQNLEKLEEELDELENMK